MSRIPIEEPSLSTRALDCRSVLGSGMQRHGLARGDGWRPLTAVTTFSRSDGAKPGGGGTTEGDISKNVCTRHRASRHGARRPLDAVVSSPAHGKTGRAGARARRHSSRSPARSDRPTQAREQCAAEAAKGVERAAADCADDT